MEESLHDEPSEPLNSASTSSEDGSGQKENVVIIENGESSVTGDLADLDPSVITYVRQLLMEGESKQSVIIVNEGSDVEQTYHLSLQASPDDDEEVCGSSSQAVGHPDLSSVTIAPPISTQNTAPFSVSISSPQGKHDVSSESKNQAMETSFSDHCTPSGTIAGQDTSNLQTVSITSGNDSRLPKDISFSTHTFSPSTSTSDHTTSVASRSSQSKASPGQTTAPQTSQAAEHLIDIAHKMIGRKPESTSRPDLMSAMNISSSDVSPEGNKYKSDSVVTLYLSSPSELSSSKIEALKDNSPIVVLQAQSDSFSSEVSKLGKIEDLLQKVNSEPGNEIHPQATSSSSVNKPAGPECNGESAPELPGSVESSGAGRDVEDTVYRCQECGYSSHNKHYYKQHVDLVHNEDRPYKCPHCDYAGKRRHALLEHMVVHSNNRPFTCGHCNASFRKKGHLTNHIKLHTSQRLVHCGVCNIQLPDSEAFEAHLRKIHKTDKLYRCKLCDHTVVDREAMIKHFQTHTESLVYTCPICDCYFGGESSFNEHVKNAHSSLSVPGSSLKSVPMNSSQGGKIVKSPPPNIMCSECGFVCSDQETMQKHMWAHIKKAKAEEGNAKVKEASKENSMGVLKKNIDAGQKTLPKDVFYQCTSCAFTSSDNSAFIKHMLAHKTQEKHLKEASAESSSLAEVKSQQDGNLPQCSKVAAGNVNPSSLFTEVMAKTGLSQAKPDNAVPFVYDKASARFRCLICNYHCEFQRTIKAHIWKHSGHQNIEYPMFDQSGNATYWSVVKPNEPSSKPAGVPESKPSSDREKSRIVSPAPPRKPLQVFKTDSGDTVHLVPVDPMKASFKPGELIQIKDNTILFPEKLGQTLGMSKFLETVALKTLEEPGKVEYKTQPEKDGEKLMKVAMRNHNEPSKDTTSSAKSVIVLPVTESTTESLSDNLNQKDEEEKDVKELRIAEDLSEGCTEPSVVVEVVDSIPPGFSLTGMKSQQGSPRVSDLDSSGGDSKFSTQLRLATVRSRDNSADSDTSASESEPIHGVRNAEPEQSKQETTLFEENHHSYSAKLRCPFCDYHVTEDFKLHLMNCKAKTLSNAQGSGKDIDGGKDESHSGITKVCESFLADDTDSTESSDETTPEDAASSKKSGICSSLLAVIEQLRERSRSESEDDRQGGQLLKKQPKKKGNQVDLSLDSIDELKNIEKIKESGGEKFRCVLCHYTSERIYNIKLHMKTHRQKKPTECSLCDFSSTSPEALQEHMLKHCKVRTYACKFCPQTFNHKSTLRAHMRAHKNQEPYLCAYCIFETTNAQEYRDHMQVHSGCSSRLRCPGCDLVLAGKDEFTAHLLACKGKSGESQARSAPASKAVSEKSTDGRTSAPDSQAKVIEDRRQESRQPRQVAAGSSLKTLAPQPAAQHVQHPCVVQGCAFSSPNLKELQEHLSVHCNPSLLMCNLCDFKAWHSRSLKSHMKRHANDQRYVQQPLEQYKCNLCGYVCHHLPSLKSHMWRHASDQSYSYEFTNDVINAAIDHDNRVDAGGQADDPELLDQVINSERKILEGELNKCRRGDGKRPICWVTFRCCSCGFETINKAKLNIHMRTHSDLIQKAQAMDMILRRKRPGTDEKPRPIAPAKVTKTQH